MDIIYKALLEAIIYISGRDVPDDIADDDLKVLENIFADLANTNPEQKSALIKAATALRDSTDDLVRRDELECFIESISENI